MSATDKTKLDGVAASANNYSHPTGDGNLHVLATGTTNNGKVLKAGATAGSLSWGTLTATDVGAAATSHPHTDATTTVAGFMSATDKTKLDGVAASANNYSHPTGDGNLHVLATGTTNNGKVLKAGATAGSLSWGTLTATDVGLGNLLPPSIRSINTAYTLQLSDASNTVSATSVLAITVPLNSTAAFPIGSQVLLLKTTASEVSIAAAAGVTLQAPGSASKIASQYGMAVLLKVATDSWILGGDII
jgi:hypothetical protein